MSEATFKLAVIPNAKRMLKTMVGCICVGFVAAQVFMDCLLLMRSVMSESPMTTGARLLLSGVQSDRAYGACVFVGAVVVCGLVSDLSARIANRTRLVPLPRKLLTLVGATFQALMLLPVVIGWPGFRIYAPAAILLSLVISRCFGRSRARSLPQQTWPS